MRSEISKSQKDKCHMIYIRYPECTDSQTQKAHREEGSGELLLTA